MGSHRFVTLNLLGVLLGSTSTGWSQIVHNQTPRPRTVSGVVVNSVTKQPIPRALVEAGQHAMLTDDEGNFEFRISPKIARCQLTNRATFRKMAARRLSGLRRAPKGPSNSGSCQRLSYPAG
jgi:hypothetical protein